MTRHIHSEWGRRVPTNPELDQTNRSLVDDPGTSWPAVLIQCFAVLAGTALVIAIVYGVAQ